MATRGTQFHALEPKLWIIAETICELGETRRGSRRELARFAGINYDRLKAAWRLGRLSADLQEKLARAGGFDGSDPTWIDPDVSPKDRSKPDDVHYPGRDTAERFRAMIRHRRGLQGAETIRIANHRPRLIDSNIATFTVEDSGQGAGLNRSAQMFFTIVLEPGYHPSGFAYGFRRVRLRLRFSEKSRMRLTNRLAYGKYVEINRAILTVRGDEHNSEWFLEVQDAILEGEFATRDNPLCDLIGLALGEEFEAELSVRLLDGTLKSLNGEALPDPQKRRIIELLSAKKLPDSVDSHGWLSLGLQKLCIVRADRI